MITEGIAKRKSYPIPFFIWDDNVKELQRWMEQNDEEFDNYFRVFFEEDNGLVLEMDDIFGPLEIGKGWYIMLKDTDLQVINPNQFAEMYDILEK